ncbi:uncharacterized protein LOC132713995 [Ruditapes philippinarum]|uniref:uncharacterized protein LOC132713995 n=1 Tax=Ruditapes philippinarum TaxID=129788 RepID=UPI00295BE456|nr:uncharacterized protein LOC132713995 [Ruditapes philippinarum]
MDLQTLQVMYDRFRGTVDSLYIKSGYPFPSNIPLSFTNLPGVFTISSHGEDCLLLNRFLKKRKKGSHIQKLMTEDADEEINFDDQALQRPFQLLLECLEEDNLKKLETIWNMNKISEKQLLVGVGVHLIKKLTGEAYTTEDRACEVCPCGCGGKLDTTAMCIGKLVL